LLKDNNNFLNINKFIENNNKPHSNNSIVKDNKFNNIFSDSHALQDK
jgi:hypothetical protein